MIEDLCMNHVLLVNQFFLKNILTPTDLVLALFLVSCHLGFFEYERCDTLDLVILQYVDYANICFCERSGRKLRQPGGTVRPVISCSDPVGLFNVFVCSVLTELLQSSNLK